MNGTVLYLHERDIDDSVIAEVFGDPALRPLPGVTFLQLQSNPRLTSGGLSELARVAGRILPSLGEINVSYTAVTDLSPLAGVRTLRVIDAVVEHPTGVAALAGLPRLGRVMLSTAVAPADLKSLGSKPRCAVKLVEFHRMPPRFDRDHESAAAVEWRVLHGQGGGRTEAAHVLLFFS